MSTANYLKDKDFLKKLDLDRNKTSYVNIIVLTEDELQIRTIEGQITSGSINIDGNSSMRRTCNLTFVATDKDNDLTDIDNLLSINKKIKIEIGLDNNVDDKYDKKVWFKQGVYVIVQPSITHNLQGVTVSLSCKDKMCLLNGECGGTLPASVIFNTYDQKDEDGNITSVFTPIYDIIETLLIFYGHENINNIFINDLPKETKQIVRWTGSQNLYYNANTDMYTLNYQSVVDNIIENKNNNNEDYDEALLSDPNAARAEIEKNNWTIFNYNDDIGYSFVDFIYPGELISGIGESIVSVLDKIKSLLGNFEYFYDIDGKFVFQEIKNYLNTSYTMTAIYKSNEDKINGKVENYGLNNLSILNDNNYYMDLDINGKTIYNFTEDDGLISSYSNSISYTNLKNDFHIWGENNNNVPIHYHLAIKKKPAISTKGRKVILLKDEDGKFNGRLRLFNDNDKDFNTKILGTEVTQNKEVFSLNPSLVKECNLKVFSVDVSKHEILNQKWKMKIVFKNNNIPLLDMTTLRCYSKTGFYNVNLKFLIGSQEVIENGLLYIEDNKKESDIIFYCDNITIGVNSQCIEIEIKSLYDIMYNQTIASQLLDINENYIPADWRAELYLQGLELLKDKKRPDQYQQEILDLFDAIYDFSIDNHDGTYGSFKTDILYTPNNLLYFIDYLEPSGRIIDCSVDVLGQKVYTYHSDKINKLYETIVPNVIIINIKGDEEENDKQIDKCLEKGQSYTNVDENIYNCIAFNTTGYAADTSARELLYQYTNYNSTISLQSVPIYYLEPNRRITVHDKDSNIHGDYVIKTISLPLDGKTNMTISATKALERI